MASVTEWLGDVTNCSVLLSCFLCLLKSLLHPTVGALQGPRWLSHFPGLPLFLVYGQQKSKVTIFQNSKAKPYGEARLAWVKWASRFWEWNTRTGLAILCLPCPWWSQIFFRSCQEKGRKKQVPGGRHEIAMEAVEALPHLQAPSPLLSLPDPFPCPPHLSAARTSWRVRSRLQRLWEGGEVAAGRHQQTHLCAVLAGRKLREEAGRRRGSLPALSLLYERPARSLQFLSGDPSQAAPLSGLCCELLPT